MSKFAYYLDINIKKHHWCNLILFMNQVSKRLSQIHNYFYFCEMLTKTLVYNVHSVPEECQLCDLTCNSIECDPYYCKAYNAISFIIFASIFIGATTRLIQLQISKVSYQHFTAIDGVQPVPRWTVVKIIFLIASIVGFIRLLRYFPSMKIIHLIKFIELHS